ncbi:MAG: hypothetical protein QOI74_1765 [Micromonosporaceae bacterium]|nr:hypothetical protein [Micromonosporaceae bacterium]
MADRLPIVVAELGLLQRGAASRVHEASAEAVRPISVDGRDEVGQVAGAFGQVCTVAVEQAGQQAQLRAGMAATLVAVARRVQTLFGGLTAMLDHLERDERDTERLAAFFEVDHSVTVANRYTAGLLVLAGVSPGRVRQQPAPLADVLRAGQSQARGYQRVRLGDIPPVWVPAERIDHLAHLVAELVDNATSYSAPSTTVTVAGWDLHGRVVIQIRDAGVGMPAAHLVAANALLMRPDADTGGSRQIGLPVIARLAAWAGVQVSLRAGPDVGLIAEVTVPAAALIDAPPAAVRLAAAAAATTGSPASAAPGSPTVPATAGPARSSTIAATWPPVPARRLSPLDRAAARGRVGPPDRLVPTNRQRPAGTGPADASPGVGAPAAAGAPRNGGVAADRSTGINGTGPVTSRDPFAASRVGLPARRRGAYLPDTPDASPRRVLTDADLSPQAVAAAVSTAARALADLQRTHFPAEPVHRVSAVQEKS